MLEEAVADPEMARRVLWPLVGTVFPIQGGNPGTPWRLLKNDGNGNQTEAQAVEDGNGQVGIGKTNPGYKLDVNGNIQLDDSIYAVGELYLRPASTRVSLYDASNAYRLRIFNGVTQAIRLDSNGNSYLNGGNVGIGTSTPQQPLTLGPSRVFAIEMAAPGAPTLAASSTGGSLATGTYYYKITALDGVGQTVGGSEASVAVTGPNGKVTVSWAAVPGASSYRIYRGTTSGGENTYYTSATNSFTDTGATGTSGSLPTVTTAYIAKFGNDAIQTQNRVIYVRPTYIESAVDDAVTINQAIAALPDSGGIIMLMPGFYYLHEKITTVQNGRTKNGVKLRGYGGLMIEGPSVEPATILVWGAAAGTGPVVELKPYDDPNNNDPSTNNVVDLEISDITIDGNNTAETGLLLDRVVTSKFTNVHVSYLKRPGHLGTPSVGIKLTAVNGEQDNGCLFNMFLNCTVWGADQGVLLTGESQGRANSAHNTFVGLSVGYYSEFATSAGIFLGDCDNNCFQRVWTFPILPPLENEQDLGYGVIVKNPRDNEPGARANYFYHLQANAGGSNRSFKIIDADSDSVPTSKNMIFGYDLENGEQQPVAFTNGGSAANPARFLFWVDSNGFVHLSNADASQSTGMDGALEYFNSTLQFTVGTTPYQLAP